MRFMRISFENRYPSFPLPQTHWSTLHFPPIQAQTGRANHEMGLFACFADIYRNEGLKGLWRGVGPTAQRAAVVVGKDSTKKNQVVNK